MYIETFTVILNVGITGIPNLLCLVLYYTSIQFWHNYYFTRQFSWNKALMIITDRMYDEMKGIETDWCTTRISEFHFYYYNYTN